MKNLLLLSAALLLISISFGQSSNPCVSCNNNVIDTANYSSAIGSENISTGLNSFAGGFQSEATGDYSTALGFGCKALGNMGISLGFFAEANSSASLALGKSVGASATSSFVIGRGYDEQLLENNIGYSLMIGINSTVPTLFVGSSIGGPTRTGKIGIGNITSPEAKLHIKADDNENASILLQPTGANYYAKLLFGENGNQISAKADEDLKFITGSGKDFVFDNGNIGVGTEEPIAKLQVKNGDIFIEDIDRGIVMKSPDGNCWRGTVDNSGTLSFVQVNCDDLLTSSADQQESTTKRIHIYPNPTGNKVFISIDQQLTGSILEMVSANGKILYTETLSNKNFYVNMESYERGLYVFNIKDLNGELIESAKVIKQ